MSPQTYLLEGSGVADAAGLRAAPGAVLVEVGDPIGSMPRLLAAGRKEDVRVHPAAKGATRVDVGDAVLLPGLVNAHIHLDLTHIGPREYDPTAGFAGWAGVILSNRLYDPEPLRASVRLGISRSLAGGVVAIGDISGDWRTEPIAELQASPMLGVSFLEYFGIGRRQEQILARLAKAMSELAPLRRHPRIAVGLQPHATYTAGSMLMAWTAERRREGWPVCTHLAENPSEREFVGRGTGTFRALLERLNLWDDSIMEDVGRGLSPIRHFEPALSAAPWLVAHVNDCGDGEIDTLARSGASVAYCPRSSSYFRNHEAFGPHRYRDMLAAGVNVALGTDSIVNLPRDSTRISTLDEMRFLHARDGVDPQALLGMATANGARALGLDPALFTFGAAEKAIAGVIAVATNGEPMTDPLLAVMQSGGGVTMVLDPTGKLHQNP
jgi:cytosine/adenosine deaminase-related metal-dependent hydrolase